MRYIQQYNMSQSYTKGCRDCGQQIRMDQVNGRWGAYNFDGSYHLCTKKQQPPAEVKQQPLTLDQIDVKLRRVEKMLFNQNGA